MALCREPSDRPPGQQHFIVRMSMKRNDRCHMRSLTTNPQCDPGSPTDQLPPTTAVLVRVALPGTPASQAHAIPLGVIGLGGVYSLIGPLVLAGLLSAARRVRTASASAVASAV